MGKESSTGTKEKENQGKDERRGDESSIIIMGKMKKRRKGAGEAAKAN